MDDSDHGIEAVLEQMKEKIAENGWGVAGIFPHDDAPPERVPFAYTIGLTAAGLPELFVNGLPYPTAQRVLNAAARVVLARDVELGDQIRSEEVELSVDLRIAACETTSHLAIARALYDPERVACQQVLWPDAQGHWPDDSEFQGHQPFGPAD